MASSLHHVNAYKDNGLFGGYFKSNSSLKNTNTKNNKAHDSSKPLKLSFSSKHSHMITFNDSATAVKYLSLPVSNYSVLDSNLITKATDSNDTFLFTLPLGDILGSLSLGNSKVTNPAANDELDRLLLALQTSVNVTPSLDLRLITMSSGNFVFIPTLRTRNISGTAQHAPNFINTNSASIVLPSQTLNLSSLFPRWLVWGGDFSSLDDLTAVWQQSDSESGMQVVTLSPLKSSIQAGFKLKLTWDAPAQQQPDREDQVARDGDDYDGDSYFRGEENHVDVELHSMAAHNAVTHSTAARAHTSHATRRRGRRQKKFRLTPAVYFAVAVIRKIFRNVVGVLVDLKESILKWLIPLQSLHFFRNEKLVSSFKSLQSTISARIASIARRNSLTSPSIPEPAQTLISNLHPMGIVFKEAVHAASLQVKRAALRLYALRLPQVGMQSFKALASTRRFATRNSATFFRLVNKSFSRARQFLSQQQHRPHINTVSIHSAAAMNVLKTPLMSTASKFVADNVKKIGGVIATMARYVMMKLKMRIQSIRGRIDQFLDEVLDEIAAEGRYTLRVSRSTRQLNHSHHTTPLPFINNTHASNSKNFQRLFGTKAAPVLLLTAPPLEDLMSSSHKSHRELYSKAPSIAEHPKNGAVSTVRSSKSDEMQQKSELNPINSNSSSLSPPLQVKASIQVWVDLNLPLSDETVVNALAFPPIKLLLTQAGQLLISTVLKSTAPHLSRLMIKDYEDRRRDWTTPPSPS
eukprot:CAMPEP_0170061262 /NCGR_PEP_ID=MMETSP0019_2-20121128/2891_1 /TAXON_ID=98059 /ORGANISM="Dinobryon sp., Strain UTEXLB2267" /LENGTH=748 /DNA_ID=CAMNT_0010267039 /DNA_START=736 /DNA_END=2982 /DNA_ORIENTATION=-